MVWGGGVFTLHLYCIKHSVIPNWGNLYKTIGYDTIALAFMLQVTHTECGGSVINNCGWRDEDDEEKMMTSDAPILTVSSNSACLT